MPVTIPSARTTGDLITASIYNEIISALEHILTLQVDSANLALATSGKALGWNIGDLKIAARTGDIGNQWLVCNGRTIGSGSSGATGRAHADMQALFVYLWEAFDNTTLEIQNSSGVGTVRGSTAEADFNAHKRMPIFDMRGRTIAGADPTNLLITQAWANHIGRSGGAEKHTLTSAEMPVHTHGSGDSGFAIVASSGGTAAFSAGANIKSSAITASAGSGVAHNNLQPTIIMNYLMYTGL